jgi:hypothetical protein
MCSLDELHLKCPFAGSRMRRDLLKPEASKCPLNWSSHGYALLCEFR